MPAPGRCLPVAVLAACAGHPSRAAHLPAPVRPAAPVAACASPAHRQLDFWIGDWDLVVRARATPDGPWVEAPGHQHVEAILGGCAISEAFSADGPDAPWAGRSYSSWQPALGQWRQTWVDDSGSYLAFTGGVVDGVVTLVGEPRVRDGHRVVMRMVFLDVTADALRWEWQRQQDDGPWIAQMIITYRRAGVTPRPAPAGRPTTAGDRAGTPPPPRAAPPA